MFDYFLNSCDDEKMIYDCFTFFNELEILELRLNILYPFVDYFVIVEANKTHTGKDKDFLFELNKQRYKNFLDKIIYIKLEDLPDIENSKSDTYGNKWLLENYQRDKILDGLKNCKPDDIIIISDCDEIPSPEAIKRYKKGLFSLSQLRFAFNYNTIYANAPYSQSAKICTYDILTNPKQKIKESNKRYCQFSSYGKPTYLRFCRGKKIKNGGWHFSYISDVENLILKASSIVEQQFNNFECKQIADIEKSIQNNEDVLKRGDYFVNLKVSNLFPEYLLKNIDKYSEKINKKNQISFFHLKLITFFFKVYSKYLDTDYTIYKIFGIKIKIKNKK